MPGYRVEYAASARAKCIGRKPCKGTPIAKGQIRFGTWVTLHDHGSFKWRHWGCLSSSVLKNVADELDNQIEDLDGFEDLKPEDQMKIKKAFEIGSIDPADVPASAVAEKDPKTEEEENDANPKKRKRAPAKKKTKASETIDNDENEGPEDPEEKKPKTKKKTQKKVTEGKKKKAINPSDE